MCRDPGALDRRLFAATTRRESAPTRLCLSILLVALRLDRASAAIDVLLPDGTTGTIVVVRGVVQAARCGRRAGGAAVRALVAAPGARAWVRAPQAQAADATLGDGAPLEERTVVDTLSTTRTRVDG